MRIIFALFLSTTAVAAPGSLEVWSLSSDIPVTLNSQLLLDHQVGEDRGLGIEPALFPALPEAADLVALDWTDPQQILFCLDIPISLTAGSSHPADVLAWNGATLSRAFDSTAAGIPGNVGCDAVARSDAGLLLSFDAPLSLPMLVKPADIVDFDGANFSIVLDATSAGLADSADIDAITRGNDGSYWVSFAQGGHVGAITYGDEDVLAWQPAGNTWSVVRQLVGDSDRWRAANLDALSVRFLTDALFANGFE